MRNGDQELNGWSCITLKIFTGNGERLRLHVRRPRIDQMNVMKGGDFSPTAPSPQPAAPGDPS